jgi:hypothetical protein
MIEPSDWMMKANFRSDVGAVYDRAYFLQSTKYARS